MADIALTAANISVMPQTVTRPMTAGGAGNIGDAVYIAADEDVEQTDASVAGTAYAFGVVVAIQNGKTTFVAGDAVTVAVSGPVEGFSGMTANDVLYTSDNAGKIADASGVIACKIGRAMTATMLWLIPQVTEV